MDRTLARPGLSCPDCRLDLQPVLSGSVHAHRCRRCHGVWLDPGSFRRICDEEAAPAEERSGPVHDASERPPQPERARQPTRYRPCPACQDLMSRTNFARVSGIVIDVCRPHGAWFDPGELGAIRAFLRAGGAGRFARHEAVGAELAASRRSRGVRSRVSTLHEVYDVLAGGGGPWDVPSKAPRLLVAAAFAALGAWSLWGAFHPDALAFRTLGSAPAVLGVLSLYFAWRALGQWLGGRRP